MAPKIKEIHQLPNELARDHDKIFKDLFSQISYIIDKDWFGKWFITKLL